MDPIAPAAGLIPMIVFGALWLAAFVAGLVGYFILIIAVWRVMRAPESLAASLKMWVSSKDKN